MLGFVLGNGRSRLLVDLNELKNHGAIYGCNALYREFTPDYLVCVDGRMIHEIGTAGYQLEHEVWTNPIAETKHYSGFKYFTPSLGWSSGPSALNLASKHNCEQIFIIGFDYVGTQGRINNVYADTENYRSATDTATYYGNWQKQTEQVIKQNPHIKYYRVVDSDNYYTLDLHYKNFKEITIEDLKSLLNTRMA